MCLHLHTCPFLGFPVQNANRRLYNKSKFDSGSMSMTLHDRSDVRSTMHSMVRGTCCSPKSKKTVYTRILHHKIETSVNEGSDRNKLALPVPGSEIKSRLICKHTVDSSTPASFGLHLGIEGERCIPRRAQRLNVLL